MTRGPATGVVCRMAYTSVQKIRFDDVDGAGIVYYPRFFHLCHAAMEDFFDDAAPFSYPDMINKRRLGFPSVRIDADFSAPLMYGDVVIVTLDCILAVLRAHTLRDPPQRATRCSVARSHRDDGPPKKAVPIAEERAAYSRATTTAESAQARLTARGNPPIRRRRHA